MKNLLDEVHRRALLERLGRLSPDAAAEWGSMSVGQMVCHLADPMRIALGELKAADRSNLLTRTVMRWMVLAGVPAPKGKVKTFPEIDQGAGGGTAPTGFAEDQKALRERIDRMVSHAAEGKEFSPSPVFGRLSPRAWGRLMAIHMDHHLRQFGA